MDAQGGFTQRFSTYFARKVAEDAAKSLSDGAEIECKIKEPSGTEIETFTFTRSGKKNQVLSGPARDPQLCFTLTQAAAEQVLNDPADDIGTIGVNIAKLIVSSDESKKASIQFKVGFFTLFTKGYLGVVTAGGSAFASFLASRGLNGVDGIKAVLKKVKG